MDHCHRNVIVKRDRVFHHRLDSTVPVVWIFHRYTASSYNVRRTIHCLGEVNQSKSKSACHTQDTRTLFILYIPSWTREEEVVTVFGLSCWTFWWQPEFPGICNSADFDCRGISNIDTYDVTLARHQETKQNRKFSINTGKTLAHQMSKFLN